MRPTVENCQKWSLSLCPNLLCFCLWCTGTSVLLGIMPQLFLCIYPPVTVADISLHKKINVSSWHEKILSFRRQHRAPQCWHCWWKSVLTFCFYIFCRIDFLSTLVFSWSIRSTCTLYWASSTFYGRHQMWQTWGNNTVFTSNIAMFSAVRARCLVTQF